MHAAYASWIGLSALAVGLGGRHGFDPDHLAAVDGIVRANASPRPRLAGWTGVLFCLGHGAVVLAVAAASASFGGRWTPPAWLDTAGALISVVFLFALAALNLGGVRGRAQPTPAGPVGLRAALFRIGCRPAGPFRIAGIGVLFAVSFDTLSQAALFAVMAGRFGGMSAAISIAGCFVLGMAVVGGTYGWWVARLARRADRRARLASRVMTAGVGLLSLALGVLLLSQLVLPQAAGWGAGHGALISGAVVVATLLSFLAAMIATRRIFDGQPRP